MSSFPGLSALQNLHPLFVHFPIALILVTLLFELLWWVFKKEEFREFATYLLYLSALASIAAVASGLVASNSLGHDSPGHEFVHQHRDVMYWMSGLLNITAAAVLFIKNLRIGDLRKVLLLPLLLISGLLVYGADKGGLLVFEHGMGVNATTMQQEESHEMSPGDKSHHQEQKAEPKEHSHGDDHQH